LARNFVRATPTVIGRPTRSRRPGAAAPRSPRRAGDPPHPADVEERLVDREALDQRRRVVEDAKHALLASLYADMRGRTTTASGQRRRARRPPIAVRTPRAFAS
jgi:hypothetical protein